MRIRRISLGPLETNCWIVDDDAGGPAVVIDPADEPTALLRALDGTVVAAVVLTHGHFDHLGAAGALVETTGAPLLVHEQDAPFITSPSGTGGAMFGFQLSAPAADRTLADGDTVEAGRIALAVLHTPGHTPGCICLHAPGHLFSGDTLFAGSVGRTDFPRGDARALSESIATRIAVLPDATVVHPGHGPETTIGRERLVNPFFPRA
ncbi:MAG TPA: MBL fold metallo-hydrolase [Coriobacteriia bacterium]|nr:MBL fold metallo-hydrolase [Coriobacteriia bacterium]